MYSALILAAGEGKRMKSKHPKVLHDVAFKPLISWVLEATRLAQQQIIVIGHGGAQVKAYLGDTVQYAVQEQQLGTGHAVIQAKEFLTGKSGSVVILSGDTPLITQETVNSAFQYHQDAGNTATIITAVIKDSTGYGRIVRDANGDVKKIVEHKDANDVEKKINEINSGMYVFEISDLLDALDSITNNNAQGEYYLTDTIEILLGMNKKIGAFIVDDSDEVLGINDRSQLAEANAIMRRRIVKKHMAQGVTFISPDTVNIGNEVEIGMDTVIMSNTILSGSTKIGEDCIIGPNSKILNSTIGNGTVINSSEVLDSIIGCETKVGPFAYVRPNSNIGDHIKIGDFVEIKNATLDEGTKVSHLTYIGDADIGKNVNFGCGCVVVNYDGKKKYRTTVGNNAFIGCNTNLISPVKVEDNAFVAAGSTITDDVPKDGFAIARSRQINKTDWKRK